MSTLDVLFTFYILFGTNLLTQCQVPVPVFSMFLTPFRGDFETESKRKKIPEKIFSGTEDSESLGAKPEEPQGPHKPPPRGQGGTPCRLVGPLGALCPMVCAYISPKIPQKFRRSSKVIFRRRKLLSLQDPIWGTSWCPAGGGFGHERLLHQHHDLSDDA